jgi:hypothetical protein
LYIGWGWINTVSGCWFKGNDLVALYFDWAVNSIDVVNSNFEGNHNIGIIANDGYAMRVEGCCFESGGGPAMVANRMRGLSYRANYHEANNLNTRLTWYQLPTNANVHVQRSTNPAATATTAPAATTVEVCAELVLNGATTFRLSDLLCNVRPASGVFTGIVAEVDDDDDGILRKCYAYMRVVAPAWCVAVAGV